LVPRISLTFPPEAPLKHFVRTLPCVVLEPVENLIFDAFTLEVYLGPVDLFPSFQAVAFSAGNTKIRAQLLLPIAVCFQVDGFPGAGPALFALVLVSSVLQLE